MHTDLFDEVPKKLLGLFRAFGCEDVFDFVGEVGEVDRDRRRVPVCGELAVEVGFVAVEPFEAVTEAADALVAERG